MNKKLIDRIFVRTILTIAFAGLGGYAVFTTGNAPTVLKETPATFYLILGTYILSVILVWLGQTVSEIRIYTLQKEEEQ